MNAEYIPLIVLLGSFTLGIAGLIVAAWVMGIRDL